MPDLTNPKPRTAVSRRQCLLSFSCSLPGWRLAAVVTAIGVGNQRPWTTPAKPAARPQRSRPGSADGADEPHPIGRDMRYACRAARLHSVAA
jgi:hypothetical protein